MTSMSMSMSHTLIFIFLVGEKLWTSALKVQFTARGSTATEKEPRDFNKGCHIAAVDLKVGGTSSFTSPTDLQLSRKSSALERSCSKTVSALKM